MVNLSIINVQAGKRYRFRLVSISCDPSYMFSIDGHKLTVIEADGQSTLPVEVDSIQIFAGTLFRMVTIMLMSRLVQLKDIPLS